MRTAIGAAERRSHLTFPLVADTVHTDVRRSGRVLAALLKTFENGRACVGFVRSLVRHRNYKTVPSSFNFWVDWIVFFSGAGSKRRVVCLTAE